MHPRSCGNCCFNGLQTQDVGLSVGFCVEHRLVLHEPGATTCARLFRRDVGVEQARCERVAHASTTPDRITFLRDPARDVIADGAADRDTSLLETDRVGAVVVEYRRLDSTATSLNRLNEIETTRAEVARLGLSRAYVNWCTENPKGNQPPWISGFRFLWWTRQSLRRPPVVEAGDLRNGARLPLREQEDLAKWSVMMERLTFLSDMGVHAARTHPKDPVARLRTLADEAAEAITAPTFGGLMRWIGRFGWRIAESAFPASRYEALREAFVPAPDETGSFAPRLPSAPGDGRTPRKPTQPTRSNRTRGPAQRSRRAR